MPNCIFDRVTWVGCDRPAEPYQQNFNYVTGLPVSFAAAVANETEPTGAIVMNNAIQTATSTVFSRVENALSPWYKTVLESYNTNVMGQTKGAAVTAPIAGKELQFKANGHNITNRIIEVSILSNTSGDKELTIEDGNGVTTYPVTLIAGSRTKVIVDHTVVGGVARVYFDPAEGVQLYSMTTPSVGCSSCQSSKVNAVRQRRYIFENPIQGSNAGNLTTVSTSNSIGVVAQSSCSIEQFICGNDNLATVAIWYAYANIQRRIVNSTQHSNETLDWRSEKLALADQREATATELLNSTIATFIQRIQSSNGDICSNCQGAPAIGNAIP